MLVTEISATKRPLRIQLFAWMAALILLIMSLAQLFKYEDFPVTVSALLATNDAAAATVVAALIVISEVFALPYLLNVKLSPLMKIVSSSLAGLVSLFWLLIALTSSTATNSGLFGDTLVIPGGILAAAIVGLLLGSVASTILWDFQSKPKA